MDDPASAEEQRRIYVPPDAQERWTTKYIFSEEGPLSRTSPRLHLDMGEMDPNNIAFYVSKLNDVATETMSLLYGPPFEARGREIIIRPAKGIGIYGKRDEENAQKHNGITTAQEERLNDIFDGIYNVLDRQTRMSYSEQHQQNRALEKRYGTNTKPGSTDYTPGGSFGGGWGGR